MTLAYRAMSSRNFTLNASGVVPAAIEMMDQRITQAVEAFVSAGYPTDAGAILLVEAPTADEVVSTAAAAAASTPTNPCTPSRAIVRCRHACHAPIGAGVHAARRNQTQQHRADYRRHRRHLSEHRRGGMVYFEPTELRTRT